MKKVLDKRQLFMYSDAMNIRIIDRVKLNKLEESFDDHQLTMIETFEMLGRQVTRCYTEDRRIYLRIQKDFEVYWFDTGNYVTKTPVRQLKLMEV